jgi:hypothetical protein
MTKLMPQNKTELIITINHNPPNPRKIKTSSAINNIKHETVSRRKIKPIKTKSIQTNKAGINLRPIPTKIPTNNQKQEQQPKQQIFVTE